MATGPEHYRKAEELLAKARAHLIGNMKPDPVLIAEAQLHAMLAQAAATALLSGTATHYPGGGWADITHPERVG